MNKLTSETCSCDTCKSMCIRPGIPTPSEALELIEAGLGEYLKVDEGVDYENEKFSYWPILMPNAGFPPFGCDFQDRDTKLCLLHDLNLKPLECRLAHCNQEKWTWLDPTKEQTNHKLIQKMWNTPEGRDVVAKFLNMTF